MFAILAAFLVVGASGQQASSARGGPLEPVRLQLKWKHQFQFAGYYAAIERGYYAEAGLEVDLIEAVPGEDPIHVVLNGEAEFGVGTSELVLLRSAGEPVVVLAAIYQHSPLALLARRDAGIDSLHGLAGKRVMIEPMSAELFAYLKHEGLDAATVGIVDHSLDVEDLLAGRVEAMSAYQTDEPFSLAEAGVEIFTFTPRAGGIDFYGDNLFTTEEQIRRNPARVDAFLEASLRGWDYAFAHPEEMVDLILEKYSLRKSREHLLFEAERTIELARPDLIAVGHMNPGRWRHIAETYGELGMLQRPADLEGLLYAPGGHPTDLRWVYWTIAGVSVLAVAALGWALPLTILNRRLRRAKDAAEAAIDAQSHYLAVMSHEIRTPLNGLSGFVQLLKDTPLDRIQRDYVRTLERTTANMLKLIDDVLDYSKINAGPCSLDLQPVCLEEFLAEITDLFTPAATAKNVSLRSAIHPTVPVSVRTDPTRLRQVLTNLLSNGVKFTDVGYVDVNLDVVPHTAEPPDPDAIRLRFRVSDTGVGIRSDELDKIFDPYRQADGSGEPGRHGTGLGLPISRRLAELLGGGLTVESRPGEGSTFTVEIEARRVPSPVAGSLQDPRKPAIKFRRN